MALQVSNHTSLAQPVSTAPAGIPCTPSPADMAWMLMSTVLVLGMFPGVAFFEAGLLRRKNTTSILAQVFCGMTILSVMWYTVGFTLTFSPTENGFIGDFRYIFFYNVGFDDCFMGFPIPSALYATFQMMFASITPLLMTGAYAERLSWWPFIIFTMSWEVLVYYPVAHWMWAVSGWLHKWGAQDFAGGIVIHTTAGVSSLVAVVVLGKRSNFHKYMGEFPYSSLPNAAIGATLLWTGWFGFNGGSALGANPDAVHAVVNSQIGAAVTSCVYMFIVYYKTGKPSTIAILNGAIAGLAGVTPASGYITPIGALVLGVLLGIITYSGIHVLKHKLGFDDALDVSTVHGLTGVFGSLYIGIAGYKTVNSKSSNGVIATKGKDWDLLGKQFVAVIVCGLWAGLWSWIILRVTAKFFRLRVTEEHEARGLDYAIHCEEAHGPRNDSMLHLPEGFLQHSTRASSAALPPDVASTKDPHLDHLQLQEHTHLGGIHEMDHHKSTATRASMASVHSVSNALHTLMSPGPAAIVRPRVLNHALMHQRLMTEPTDDPLRPAEIDFDQSIAELLFHTSFAGGGGFGGQDSTPTEEQTPPIVAGQPGQQRGTMVFQQSQQRSVSPLHNSSQGSLPPQHSGSGGRQQHSSVPGTPTVLPQRSLQAGPSSAYTTALLQPSSSLATQGQNYGGTSSEENSTTSLQNPETSKREKKR